MVVLHNSWQALLAFIFLGLTATSAIVHALLPFRIDHILLHTLTAVGSVLYGLCISDKPLVIAGCMTLVSFLPAVALKFVQDRFVQNKNRRTRTYCRKKKLKSNFEHLDGNDALSSSSNSIGMADIDLRMFARAKRRRATM